LPCGKERDVAGKRDLLARVFANESAERAPVGFWFHYAENELLDGLADPGIVAKNLEGAERYFNEVEPDFVKIMTDGFFVYPNEAFLSAQSAADLKRVAPIGERHEWIEKQVEFAKTLSSTYRDKVYSFYNIFAPKTIFKFCHKNQNQNVEELLASLILEDKGAVAAAFDVVANDIALLSRRIITEARVDGIYYSTQDPSDSRVTDALRREIFVKNDHHILNEASKVSSTNILHICGYHGHNNKLEHFVDYPAQIINWAAVVEGVPLSRGKKLFGGKPVIGGFDNTENGVLYRGSKVEIEAETERLLKDAGTRGVILGADCTVPKDIILEHFDWVRDRAAAFR
jgi:uroporphyrinogen decarboxylase